MPESFAEKESRERAEARGKKLAARRAARRLAERTEELEESTTASFAPEDVGAPVELVFEAEPPTAHPAPGTVTTYPTHSAAMCENCEELIVLFDGFEWDHVDTAETTCQP